MPSDAVPRAGDSLPPASLEDPKASQNPILSSLSLDDRAQLAGYMMRRQRQAGEVVVREGDSDRAMYFVLEGTGHILRGELELGRVRAGDQFGELGLVLNQARAASISAETDLTLARLSLDDYERLSEERPALALRFMRALMSGVATRLADMTESVGVLLRERSLPRRTEAKVRLPDRVATVRTGTPVGSLLPEMMGDKLVVGALFDRKPVSLAQPISSDCSVEPLTTGEWEGQRIYRESLALVLLEALGQLGQDARLGHSVGFAQRVTLLGKLAMDDPLHLCIATQKKMKALVDAELQLREEWWTVDEAREYFRARGRGDAAALLLTWRDPAVPLITYGKEYALRMGPLMPSTKHLSGFRVVPDGEGLLLLYGSRGASRRLFDSNGDRLPDEAEQLLITLEARAASHSATTLTHEQGRWLNTLEMNSVGHFNQACINGSVSELIQVSEGFQEKRIGHIADEIRSRYPAIRIICVAGPSSSGKTTFIRRLRTQLQVNAITPFGLSLDDYYVNREDTPRDASGEWDFEAFDALKVELLQEHLARLLRGDTVKTAHFDFVSGIGNPEGGPELTLGERGVLMAEGIHGLNPKLLGDIPKEHVFRIFVCPLAQLPFDRLTRVHASDVRLLRRIVRDRHGRGYSAADNIARWPSVRSGERRHIFPHQRAADAVFDTSLIYELSVLKVFAERYLLEVPSAHASYSTAFRLLKLLDRFVTIYPDHVPPTSILREFIGGSGFEY